MFKRLKEAIKALDNKNNVNKGVLGVGQDINITVNMITTKKKKVKNKRRK